MTERHTPLYTWRLSIRYAGAEMHEILFLVEPAPEGGYTARALNASIFTEADDLESLHLQVRDAVRCHFEEGQAPRFIRLNFTHEELIAV